LIMSARRVDVFAMPEVRTSMYSSTRSAEDEVPHGSWPPRTEKYRLLFCVSVSLVFQCPARRVLSFFFGQKFGFVPCVRRNSPEMTHPTNVLTNPTAFFRANFRANFGHMERA
jgi:hypothetical protein